MANGSDRSLRFSIAGRLLRQLTQKVAYFLDVFDCVTEPDLMLLQETFHIPPRQTTGERLPPRAEQATTVKKRSPKMRPEFTVRLSEPPAYSVFDLRPDAPGSTVFRSPATPFSARRVNAKNDLQQVCILPEPETRNGLSLARNDAFAPLRGQCSRPVPSLPRRRSFADPFDRGSSARFGFEAKPGENHHL
jgi:hypothetical protein